MISGMVHLEGVWDILFCFFRTAALSVLPLGFLVISDL
jgi:hypothetical protein